MKKVLSLVFSLLMFSQIATAQFTSVTATITDVDGQTWNNGKWTATLVNPNPQVPPTINGTPLTAAQMNLSGTMSSGGVITASMASNAVIVPGVTYWSFTICPNASVSCSVVSASISGTSQNISSTLSSGIRIVRFPASPTSYGYADAEVAPIPNPGGQYYNVTSLLTRIWNGSTWINSGGGGSSLPTATQPGQIISSSAAGTTYAVQGQVFYSQSGDTIASIETECSSLCTYIVTAPQTITLAADHTLSSNVQLKFLSGGNWTLAGGHILNIPGNVDGTLNQHFAGATVKFGQAQALVPAEWFGAIGDWNGTTGTDNTASLQAALNSITVGQVLLQSKSYAMTACNLQITASYVGIKGSSQDSVALTADPTSSTLVCRSASADIVHIAGSSSNVFSNQFDHFTIIRSVAPTVGSNGFYITNTSLARFDWVSSNASNYGFHIVGCSGCGADYFFNTGAYWYDVTLPVGMEAVGYYLDSTGGFPTNSTVFENAGANGYADSPGTFITLKSKGQNINDIFVDGLQSTQADYGIWLEYTGGGVAGSCSDLHFRGAIIDQPRIAGIYATGLTNSCTASLDISAGWIASAVAGTIGVDIENSSSVAVIGNQILMPLVGVKLGGTSINNTVLGNTFISGATGILVSSVSSSPNMLTPNQFTSAITTPVSDAANNPQINSSGFTGASITTSNGARGANLIAGARFPASNASTVIGGTGIQTLAIQGNAPTNCRSVLVLEDTYTGPARSDFEIGTGLSGGTCTHELYFFDYNAGLMTLLFDPVTNNAHFAGTIASPGYLETLTTPASSSAACTAGQFTDDANFHYVCTATNTWKRSALSSF